MKFSKLIGTAIFIAVNLTGARAADLSGKWSSTFDSQIGPQKYTYEFKVEGDKFTGKASYDHSTGKGNSMLTEIKLDGENVSFSEALHVREMDLTVTYSGKISGDELKLNRVVSDFATEQIVAKRMKVAETKTDPAT